MKKKFVCSRPSEYNQTEFGLNIGQQLLAEYSEAFNYSYATHMSKMALVAVPDLKSSAIENFGKNRQNCHETFPVNFIAIISSLLSRPSNVP